MYVANSSTYGCYWCSEKLGKLSRHLLQRVVSSNVCSFASLLYDFIAFTGRVGINFYLHFLVSAISPIHTCMNELSHTKCWESTSVACPAAATNTRHSRVPRRIFGGTCSTLPWKSWPKLFYFLKVDASISWRIREIKIINNVILFLMLKNIKL